MDNTPTLTLVSKTGIRLTVSRKEVAAQLANDPLPQIVEVEGRYTALTVSEGQYGSLVYGPGIRDEATLLVRLHVRSVGPDVEIEWLPGVEEAPGPMHCWLDSDEPYVDAADCPQLVVKKCALLGGAR